uniref:Uncharacterized protein n=1 Tax=Arundo donax TaxID=35708 RepID=A0A0A9F568_ARUDO
MIRWTTDQPYAHLYHHEGIVVAAFHHGPVPFLDTLQDDPFAAAAGPHHHENDALRRASGSHHNLLAAPVEHMGRHEHDHLSLSLLFHQALEPVSPHQYQDAALTSLTPCQ